MNENIEILSLESLSESELPTYLDREDDNYYNLLFGHLLPIIDQVVKQVGSETQIKIYHLAIHEQKSFREIGSKLRISKRYAELQLIGRFGLAGKIREELIQLGFINEQTTH